MLPPGSRNWWLISPQPSGATLLIILIINHLFDPKGNITIQNKFHNDSYDWESLISLQSKMYFGQIKKNILFKTIYQLISVMNKF
jgi:hypothetical protein